LLHKNSPEFKSKVIWKVKSKEIYKKISFKNIKSVFHENDLVVKSSKPRLSTGRSRFLSNSSSTFSDDQGYDDYDHLDEIYLEENSISLDQNFPIIFRKLASESEKITKLDVHNISISEDYFYDIPILRANNLSNLEFMTEFLIKESEFLDGLIGAKTSHRNRNRATIRFSPRIFVKFPNPAVILSDTFDDLDLQEDEAQIDVTPSILYHYTWTSEASKINFKISYKHITKTVSIKVADIIRNLPGGEYSFLFAEDLFLDFDVDLRKRNKRKGIERNRLVRPVPIGQNNQKSTFYEEIFGSGVFPFHGVNLDEYNEEDEVFKVEIAYCDDDLRVVKEKIKFMFVDVVIRSIE